MKKIIAILTAALLAGNMSAYAADNAAVYVDGERQDFTVRAEQIDGTVIIPIRPIFERFNYSLEWDGMRKRVTATTAIGNIIFGLGVNIAAKNGNSPYVMKTYPRLLNGQTMIPIDFAADCVGKTIQYIDSTESLMINSK